MTRRIARRAWRLLRPGHTRPARTNLVPPPPKAKRVDVTIGEGHLEDRMVELMRDAIKARPDQLEDVLRRESEAKTRRLEAERARQINELQAQAIHALGLDQNGDRDG